MRITLSVLLAFVLASCDATGTPPEPGESRAASAAGANATPRGQDASDAARANDAAGPLAGLSCKATPAGWTRTCAGQGYEVTGSLDVCQHDGASFGVVLGKTPIIGTDRVIDGRPIATFAPGQFVCVQFVAEPRGGANDPQLYVTSVEPSSVPDCRDHDCGDANAVSHWNDPPKVRDCGITDRRYTAGCVAGWVRRADIDEYSMGLGGELAEGAGAPSAAADASGSLPSAPSTVYSRTRVGDGECVAGARVDDLGHQQALVSGPDASGRAQWSAVIHHDADFSGNRATHCACDASACFVAVATDTQQPQTLSQTLLSIVRIDRRTGKVIGSRNIQQLPGATGLHSAWLTPGADNFTLGTRVIELRGQWRARAEDPAQEFRLALPVF